MCELRFAENAWEDYLYWQTQDKKTLKKINALLKDVQRSPYEGEGKPEPLKNNKTGMWSRRINETDRLVYAIDKDVIYIFQCKGHYDD